MPKSLREQHSVSSLQAALTEPANKSVRGLWARGIAQAQMLFAGKIEGLFQDSGQYSPIRVRHRKERGGKFPPRCPDDREGYREDC
jgi:hypothetical protein